MHAALNSRVFIPVMITQLACFRQLSTFRSLLTRCIPISSDHAPRPLSPPPRLSWVGFLDQSPNVLQLPLTGAFVFSRQRRARRTTQRMNTRRRAETFPNAPSQFGQAQYACPNCTSLNGWTGCSQEQLHPAAGAHELGEVERSGGFCGRRSRPQKPPSYCKAKPGRSA